MGRLFLGGMGNQTRQPDLIPALCNFVFLQFGVGMVKICFTPVTTALENTDVHGFDDAELGDPFSHCFVLRVFDKCCGQYGGV